MKSLIRSTLCAAALMSAQAASLNFERSQTLNGWHERAHTGKVWTDLAPDAKSLISIDANGDLRGFETGGEGAATRWLRSPAFTLDASGDLTVSSVFMAGGTMPASDSLVPATKSSVGFGGLALRDVSSGNFVLTKSAVTSWAQVTFTAAELLPYVGQMVTVDILNQRTGDFSVNRPITVPGSLFVPQMLSFAFPTLGAATISGTHIAITVPHGTDVTALAPTYTHNGTSASPASGAAQDFSRPVHYLVTATDKTSTDFVATVTVSPASAAKEMLTFGPYATITGTNIVWTVPHGTDVKKLAPTYTVSPFATGSPPSGSTHNFTRPVTCKVTAQDGSATDYFVNVTVARDAQIVVGAAAPALEQYAAAELQRYLYARTGELLPIRTDEAPLNKDSFLIGQKSTNRHISEWVSAGTLAVDTSDPGEQGYVLRKIVTQGQGGQGPREILAIAGSDSAGTLYGVYGLLQDHYDIGFALEGDVIPQTKSALVLAQVDERKKPKQSVRGILPWVNFFQSATVYSFEDYRFVIDQMAKMRMNLLNIHNYNGNGGHQELNFPWNPAVRYWMPTTRSGHGWGCPKSFINRYRFGGEDLFDDYDFGSEVTLHNEALTNEDICRKGTAFFQRVIAYAHRRGVRIALGVELIGDKREQEFIVKNYPDLDYVLMYQGECGGSVGHSSEFFETLKKHTKIRLGIAGWGLGGDLSTLPADLIAAPISAYSAGCVEGAQYGKREYWGCPWMERDGDRGLLGKFASSQNWYPYSMNLSSSMAAYQAASPNMTGWQTLTWRTSDAIAPKLSWVAKAPWGFPLGNPWGHVGGTPGTSAHAVNPDCKVAVAFGSYRQGNFSYKFDVQSSETHQLIPYTVTLYFAEPQAAAAEARKFNVSINDVNKLIDHDIFASAGGRHKGVEVKIPGIVCPFGTLSVEFSGVSGEPLVNAIVVEKVVGQNGNPWRLAVNCGGGAADGFAADQVYGSNSYQAYRDYAVRSYGVEAAEDLTAIINQNEPFAIGGGEAEGTPPLGDNPDAAANTAKAERQIATIDMWMGRVKDPGQQERLRLLKTRIDSTRCYNVITPIDRSDGKAWSLANSFRDRVNDISSLGMLASFQSRYVCQYFINPSPPRLKSNEPDAVPPRVIVISPPTSQPIGQGVDVAARILDEREPSCISATLFYRIPGPHEWTQVPMERRCRAIFGCRIPGSRVTSSGLEYYVKASDGTNAGYFPVTAPALPVSLVGERLPSTLVPGVPGPLAGDKAAIAWGAASGDVFIYRIYRSTSRAFAPCIANYLCFVARDKLSFTDSENDYVDQPKRGAYYYRVAAVDKAGNESLATEPVEVTY
ncbi:MAG: malectin domain-containing carbohydrate-binding protein [Verrucomicrobia bacterium]|nr:malectin domain-containing carbohydrate-binding protein [Verrucomicrobiota bacterium]